MILNKKFGKLENGEIIYAPKTLTVGDVKYYNPKPERYIREGFFPVEDKFPEEEPEQGYYYSPCGWEIIDQKISRKYELIQEEIPEENE